MAPLRDRNIINMLKLRASYGQIGLDNWSGSTYSIGRFAYMSSYSLSSQGYVINGAFVPTFSEGALVSPDITCCENVREKWALEANPISSDSWVIEISLLFNKTCLAFSMRIPTIHSRNVHL